MKRLFHGKNIITMENDRPDAVLTDGGKIIATGNYSDLKFHADEIVELGNRALLPGFIDAHGHFMLNTLAERVYISLRGCKTSDEIIKRLKKGRGKPVIIGFGFDNTLLESGYPTCDELDKVAEDVPVIAIHLTAHAVSANRCAMKCVGINSDNGVFMESLERFLKIPAAADLWQTAKNKAAQMCDSYLSKGITTVCEGAGDNNLAEMIGEIPDFKCRYIICPPFRDRCPDRVDETDKIINGPVKLLTDGSFQCETAALTDEYLNGSGYGELTHNRIFLKNAIEDIISSGRSFAVHINGDRAAAELLAALRMCRCDFSNSRNIAIHCQVISLEQLREFSKFYMTPSFFVSHIHYWGDVHRSRLLGKLRAERLDPVGDAVALGIPFSLHSDTPVTPQESLSLISDAVNRKTKSGITLGEDLRISITDALNGITRFPAYQYRLDSKLGTIKKGKLADFVILSESPLEKPFVRGGEPEVCEVYISGERVF